MQTDLPTDEPTGPAGEERSGLAPPRSALHFRLCPRCARAVPAHSGETYCINDGIRLLERCPGCGAAITSPYSRYCAGCGRAFQAELHGTELHGAPGTARQARKQP